MQYAPVNESRSAVLHEAVKDLLEHSWFVLCCPLKERNRTQDVCWTLTKIRL